MPTRNGAVIEDREQRSASVNGTAVTHSKQNGANIADHILNNDIASVKTVHLNGPELTATKTADTVLTGSKEPEVERSHVETLTSAENEDFLNGKYRH
jgi:alkyl hydroperoxide reductase subunit AhpF